jgi:zinc transport system substrate-binding protein
MDPHVWLDLDNAAKQSDRIRTSIVELMPENQEAIQANADRLIRGLAELDTQYREGVQDCRMDTFVTSHSAFAHLADRYELIQIPITGLSPESEPSPRTLADLIAQIKSSGVGYVLAEPATSRRLSETVAAEIGAEILTLHPLESLTPDEIADGSDFMSVMHDNLQTLKIALECVS